MKKISMRRVGVFGITILTYVIGLFIVYLGFLGVTLPPRPEGGELGWLYSTKPTLVGVGLTFMVSGLLILYGKVTKNRRVVGWGLLATYACFMFAEMVALMTSDWLDPRIIVYGSGVIITGFLYLRWKFKFFYDDPKHKVEEPEA